MNIVELLAQYRFESSDTVVPLRASDLEVVSLFNDAEYEACRRKVLIFDATTADICEIAVTDASATYPLHSSIVAVLTAYLEDADGVITYLSNVTRDQLDNDDSTWRETTGEPAYIIVDESSLQLSPPPLVDYTLKMEVQRTPLTAMFLPVDPVPTPAPYPLIESPEIATAHHRYLALWVHKGVLSKPNPDFADPVLAALYEKKFDNYFGKRPDVDRLRSQRANRPHHNKVW
jgi:hypothetical protein